MAKKKPRGKYDAILPPDVACSVEKLEKLKGLDFVPHAREDAKDTQFLTDRNTGATAMVSENGTITLLGKDGVTIYMGDKEHSTVSSTDAGMAVIRDGKTVHGAPSELHQKIDAETAECRPKPAMVQRDHTPTSA